MVAHRASGSSAYTDADGHPVSLPGDGDGRGFAPVEVDGREVAALVYDASLDDDPELVEAVCAAAAIALENEQLQAESEARLTELRASRQRVIAAGDAERRRLERNLHDGAQQQLLAVALQLRLIQSQIRQDPSAAEALVTNASDQLAESLRELRELARGMHPAVLEFGLASALDSLATRTTVPTAVSCEVAERLPQEVELALYFVACEALANVAKYARAQTASVRLYRTGGRRRRRDRRRWRGRRGRNRRLGSTRTRGPRRGAERSRNRHEPRRGGNGRDRGTAVRPGHACPQPARAGVVPSERGS